MSDYYFETDELKAELEKALQNAEDKDAYQHALTQGTNKLEVEAEKLYQAYLDSGFKEVSAKARTTQFFHTVLSRLC